MARQVVFSPESEAQLAALFRHVAREASPATALRFTQAIVVQCEALAALPHRGAPRDDLRRGLRTLTFRGRVTIAYSAEQAAVTIVGIFYGGQDFEALLDDRPREDDG